MLDYVPDPVYQITKGKLSSNLPDKTSSAALTIAPPIARIHIFYE